MVGCLEDSGCLATLLSAFRCNIWGGDTGEYSLGEGGAGDKDGYNNHGGDRDLVSILMLHRDVGRAGDEEEGRSVLVPARVLNRYIECECVGILEQASSCLCEGMLVNKGALCPDNRLFFWSFSEFWAQSPCGSYFHASAGIDWGQEGSGTVCPERLCSLHPWIFLYLVKDLSNLFWSHNWPCFEQEIGLEPPEAAPSLNYPVILWQPSGEEGLLLLCAVRCPQTSGQYSTSAVLNLFSYQEELVNKNVTDAMAVRYVVNTKTRCSYSLPWMRLYFFHGSTQRHQVELCQTSEERADF